MLSKPTVLVSACNMSIHIPGWGDLSHQTVFEKYLSFVTERCDSVPLILPAAPLQEDILLSLLADVDGIVLTGSSTNIHPRHYGAKLECQNFDEQRDLSSLNLIRAAATIDLPLLGICRGMQEINVAHGGTLHQAVHVRTGRIDHRSHPSATISDRYAPTHSIKPIEGSRFAASMDLGGVDMDMITVNSAHGQAVDGLGVNLQCEAVAHDGTVEMIRSIEATYIVGVQWHIEWMESCSASRVICDEFRDVLRVRHMKRHQAAEQRDFEHA